MGIPLRQPRRAASLAISNWASRPSVPRMRAAWRALLPLPGHGIYPR